MNKLLLTAALLLSSACSTTAGTEYFALPDSQYQLPDGRGNETAVQVILADPLDHGGLVYQTDPLHLNFARQNLWAAPLKPSLEASLSNKLNRQPNRHNRFVPSDRSNKPAQTVKIYVERFNGTYLGHTLIQGYTQWPNGSGRNFQIETPQQGDGYSAMVQSLDQGLERVANELTAP